ncbi:MAG: A/G-specific adenine glycosylase [Alphaproteobacteria bacterium]|nr:MAG: A/G-specific adenine glycosylase [Alphaproteobacteria bacterium]
MINNIFSHTLLRWYDAYKRTMPWRYGSPDPYHVWLSEIMLQQTTVSTVRSYFERFIDKWPTVQELAQATQDDVLHMWQGLGYYARARNLHACARIIVSQYGGVFPCTSHELTKLPGIGSYASAAIAAIAFGEPVAVVDGNIVRVMARVASIPGVFPKNRAAIVTAYEKRFDLRRPGDFAQALMDMSQMICTPRNPDCDRCPVSDQCASFVSETVTLYPQRALKKNVPRRICTALIVTDEQGRIFLQKRPARGLLGGLYEVPTIPRWDQAEKNTKDLHNSWVSSQEEVRSLVSPLTYGTGFGSVEHTFSHLRLTLHVVSVPKSLSPLTVSEGVWVFAEDIKNYALSRLMQKVLAKKNTPIP